jgi:hypothetical protein
MAVSQPMSKNLAGNLRARISQERLGWASAFGDMLLARNTLLAVYVGTAVLGTILKLMLGSFEFHGLHYLPLQNWAIFRGAFVHLIHGQDLYASFPLDAWDFYKYSPTFALLIGPLAVLPYGLGAVLWNLVNALALFFAVWSIPSVGNRKKAFVLWFVLLRLLGNIQNAQSNGLMAALMVGGWAAHERGNSLRSSLCLVLSIFTKLFGGLAMLPCLLARGRAKLVAYSAMWSALMVAAPLAVVSPKRLAMLYRSWYGRLQSDKATHLGLSLMGVLKEWFHLSIPSHYVMLVGAVVLVAVVAIRMDVRENFQFRLLVLSSVLLWVIVFNHMAESPAMIIGVTGVAIWYYFQRRSVPNLILLLLTFALTCLAPTDVVRRELSQRMHVGYLEAAPCIVVWLKVQYDLLRFDPRRQTDPEPSGP